MAICADFGVNGSWIGAVRQRYQTASESLWKAFEPELQRRLSKLDALAPLSDRIRSVLLECLPSGEASIDGAARRLGMSRRTLQRRLKEEGFAFREIVEDTREPLSRHYLVNTALPCPCCAGTAVDDDAGRIVEECVEHGLIAPRIGPI